MPPLNSYDKNQLNVKRRKMMKHPFKDQRELFPTLASTTHLSSCSQSAISLPVRDAIHSYLQSWTEHGMDWNGWMNEVQNAKNEFARLINAEPEEIAVLSSVSDAASAFAGALSFTSDRNKVVTTDIDFPCIGHVWLSHERRQANVTFLPAEEDQTVRFETYEKAIDSNTLVTSIPHVSYYNGFKQDLKSLSTLAHSNGSYLFVDAYQSAGSVAIDVKDSDVDALAAGSQKFLLGIPGIAFMYVKKELANQLEPLTTGWFSRKSPFAFTNQVLDYADGTRRFDTGTPPMINAYAARAGLSMLNQLGVERIESYLDQLSSICIETAQKHQLDIASPLNIDQKGSNTAIRVKNATYLEGHLKSQGIIVSARGDVLRVAPHFYNTEEDVIKAVEAIAHALITL
jgi:selenocysteine lyase/cysteine desulfurase